MINKEIKEYFNLEIDFETLFNMLLNLSTSCLEIYKDKLESNYMSYYRSLNDTLTLIRYLSIIKEQEGTEND